MLKLNNLKIEFKEITEDEIRSQILVDDKPIIDSNYVLDLDELEKSLDYHGKFFILTCQSDNPVHINVSKGIDINKDDSENINWQVSYSTNENHNYTFDNHEYREIVLGAVNEWRQIVLEKEEQNKLSYQDIHSFVKYSEQDDEEDLVIN